MTKGTWLVAVAALGSCKGAPPPAPRPDGGSVSSAGGESATTGGAGGTPTIASTGGRLRSDGGIAVATGGTVGPRDASTDAGDASTPDGPAPVTSRYAREVLTDGPIAFHRFEERSGTRAKDSAGAHDGTFSNGVVLGKPGAFDEEDLLIEKIHEERPGAMVFVANIIPILRSETVETESREFAPKVAQLVNQRVAAGDARLAFVDVWTDFPRDDGYQDDKVHPSAVGLRFIGTRFFEAIQRWLLGR